ncbi:MAG: N-acyl-phosphatidylethanolamine-hydrolyzing phospholipase D [Arenicella sp.]|jgi:N-acyl-phosphatidylethanolamine-hydrolysing phospholipase D
MLKKHSSRTGLIVVLAIVLVASAWGLSATQAPQAQGAPTDANGLFTNINGELSHGSIGVRFPFFLRRIATSIFGRSGAPKLTLNDGVLLREDAQNSTPTVTWIGHATLLVQMEHLTFLTDPIWSKRPSPIPWFGPNRFVKPGISIDDLPEIDFVLISHNHYDHLDLPTLRRLAKRNRATKFFVPLGNAELLRNNGIEQVHELDWGDTANIGGTTIHCLPSQHWSKRSLRDTNKALWSSWAVTGAERRFYFAGDTGYFQGFAEIGEQLGPFDLAALPIGAYEPTAMMRASHMNPEEAIQAAVDLKAQRALAIHFGTFNLSDEPIAEPPQRFRLAAQQAELDSSLESNNAWIMAIGETREF